MRSWVPPARDWNRPDSAREIDPGSKAGTSRHSGSRTLARAVRSEAVTPAPDLFVVCKNCGSEVSGFITECPYCGNRLRKRAPKLEGTQLADPGRSRRARMPRLPKLKSDEIPGIRVDPAHRPIVSIALAVACAAGAIATGAFSLVDVAVVGPVDGEWWRVLSAPFFFDDLWYAATCVLAVLLFGSLLEARHGALVPLLLFAIGGVGGAAAAVALESFPIAAGANGAAIALSVAWAMRPVREMRRGLAPEGDLIGAAVFTAVLLLMPLAAEEANGVAGSTGLFAGLLAGGLLARRR